MTAEKSVFRKRIEKYKWKLLSFRETSCEKLVRNLLQKQGQLVARYPYVYLFAPLIIIGLLSTGIFRMKPARDVSLMYTPSNARTHDERFTAEQYFGDENGIYSLKMIITAKDGESLLRPEYIDDVLHFMDYMKYNYTVHKDGMSYSFADIQINHQSENDATKVFLQLYRTMRLSNVSQNTFNFSFPVLDMKPEKLCLSTSISGVTLNPKDHQLESVKQVYVRFRSAKGNSSHAELLYNWEKKFLNPDSVFIHPTLNFVAASDRLISDELQRNGFMIRNFTPISFVVLMLFAILTTSSNDCVTSKPWEATCGVLTTILSVGGSYGIMFYAGYPFMSLLLVMPVLVLALGLDVTFIVLRSWRMTNPEMPVGDRLAETMAECGPSIVITSLTNIISAGVGAITYTPAVHMFCLSTAIAVTILFFLQITFFAAAIALGARREHAQYNAFLLCVKVKKVSEVAVPTDVARTENDEMVKHMEIHDWWYTVAKQLAKFECTYICRALVTLLLFAYWGLAIWGCTNLTLGMTPEKFFLPDSILNKYYQTENGGLHEALTLYVFVSQAPNFTNVAEAQRFNNLVREFEQLPTSFGSDATMLWVRPYNDFKEWSSTGDGDFYENMPEFLDSSLGSKWKQYIFKNSFNDSSVYVPKFFFSTVFKPAKTWGERADYTVTWRGIVDKYSEFNISIWDDENENYISDQLLAIPQNTIQDVIVTGICMALICILFIPNVFNTLCAMITIFSINVGVFGFLVHWGVGLDPISMATLLMAIGFSVDFTSHISFHYYTSEGSNQREKLTTALASIGYPMIQSGTSTALSIACICFVPSYMVWIFFKTVFLVVLFGLLHGLLILPTYLAWLPLNFWDFLYTKKQPTSLHITGSVKSTLRENKPDIVCDIDSQRVDEERF